MKRAAAATSLHARPQPFRPAGAGAMGWSFAVVLAVFGLALLWVDGGAGGLNVFGGLSREEAIREAASAGGVSWPGTTVSVRGDGERRAVVERRWLSMTEATTSIVERRDGWYDGGSPSLGPGEAVQAAIVCLVVPAIAGVTTWRLVRRSRASLASAGAGAR